MLSSLHAMLNERVMEFTLVNYTPRYKSLSAASFERPVEGNFGSPVFNGKSGQKRPKRVDERN